MNVDDKLAALALATARTLGANLRDLRNVVTQAVAELGAEHLPIWSSAQAEELGRAPIGCGTCFPSDGAWPCTSKMVANDLRAALAPSPSEPT